MLHRSSVLSALFSNDTLLHWSYIVALISDSFVAVHCCSSDIIFIHCIKSLLVHDKLKQIMCAGALSDIYLDVLVIATYCCSIISLTLMFYCYADFDVLLLHRLWSSIVYCFRTKTMSLTRALPVTTRSAEGRQLPSTKFISILTTTAHTLR